jgi:peptide/nickel transport system permease protein
MTISSARTRITRHPFQGRVAARGAHARLTVIERIALVVAALIVLMGLIGPAVAPYPPEQQDLREAFLPLFSEGHLLGTDQLGRDILSRLLHGARVSLGIAIGATLLGCAVGVSVGLVAGYRGGIADSILMRVVDTFLAFPALVLALVIAASLGPGIRNTIIAIAVVQVPGFARVARGLTVRERGSEYVQAAQVAGASWLRILRVHISRNIWIPLSAQAVFAFGHAVPGEAALSFLGLGVQPPEPSWGNMIADGYAFLSRSEVEMLVAATTIVLTVGSVSILADALRRRSQDRG